MFNDFDQELKEMAKKSTVTTSENIKNIDREVVKNNKRKFNYKPYIVVASIFIVCVLFFGVYLDATAENNSIIKKVVEFISPKNSDKDVKTPSTQSDKSTNKEANVTPAKNDNQADTASQSNITYSDYKNYRYGYSIKVPSVFTKYTDPSNGDGRQFTTEDGASVFNVWGSLSVVTDQLSTVEDWFQLDKKNAPTDAYCNLTGNSFVISYVKDDSIYYGYTIVGKTFQKGFYLTYPKKDKGLFDDIIKKIYESFDPGILDMPQKTEDNKNKIDTTDQEDKKLESQQQRDLTEKSELAYTQLLEKMKEGFITFGQNIGLTYDANVKTLVSSSQESYDNTSNINDYIKDLKEKGYSKFNILITRIDSIQIKIELYGGK